MDNIIEDINMQGYDRRPLCTCTLQCNRQSRGNLLVFDEWEMPANGTTLCETASNGTTFYNHQCNMRHALSLSFNQSPFTPTQRYYYPAKFCGDSQPYQRMTSNQVAQSDNIYGAGSSKDFRYGTPHAYPTAKSVSASSSRTAHFNVAAKLSHKSYLSTVKQSSNEPQTQLYQCRYSRGKSKHIVSSPPFQRGQICRLAKTAKRVNKHYRNNCESPTLFHFPENKVDRVFIWNFEHTIDIFNTLLNSNLNSDHSIYWNSLARKMDEVLHCIAKIHLFQSDLQEIDLMNIDDALTEENDQDLSQYQFHLDGFNPLETSFESMSMTSTSSVSWRQKLAFRYRRIKEFYNANRGNIEVLTTLLGPSVRDQWLQFRYNAECFTHGWMSRAFSPLSIINSRTNCRNVLVTKARLVPTITKVLLYGLTDVFEVDDIYSATKVGSYACFEQIYSKFGQACTYIVIGDGREQESAAKRMIWPFWRVSAQSDLCALQRALQLDYL